MAIKVIRNTEGFMSGGKFHPIRSGDDYEPDEVGEARAYAPRRATKKKAGKKKVTAKKNPGKAKSFPVGKFVKVDAIRVNRTGTIDVMRSKAPKRAARRPKR